MEVLLWLAPTAVVAVVAMGWVAWWGREGRGEVDRDESLRRLAEALDRPATQRRRAPAAAPRRPEDPTAGGAVRRTGPSPLRAAPGLDDAAPTAPTDPHERPRTEPGDPPARRVS